MQLQVNKGLSLATQGFIAVVCAIFSFSAGAQEFGCGVTSAQSSSGAALARSQALAGTTPQGTTSIVGAKRIILIRVDFPDLPGTALTNSVATNMVVNLNSFYTESSYGLTTFALLGAGSDLTPVLRMPQRADYYGTNNLYDLLRNDARNAASTAGYVLTNYDFDLICFGLVPGWNWSGMGYVGTPGVWLRNSFNAGVASHELGHNFGLNHANFWETSGQSITGPGYSVEQGDSFDTMGFALAGNNHFNARYKNLLGWIPTNDVITVITSGVYYLNSHDNINASGTRALVIPRGGGTNCWLEFRQKFTANNWLMNGAGLRWAQNSNQRTMLLDATPGSADGKNDSAIVIGRTFSDSQAGIHITPIGKGGTTPESLDVVVNIGSFPSNVAPTVTITASATNAAPGAPLTFSATASDANGDTLAYYWDFGDGTFGTNGPLAVKSWPTTGEYNVRCLVTDMKGGLAASSVLLQIGTPTTYRISGTAMAGGNPLMNARIYASSTRMTYTDSNGRYSLVGLTAGAYSLNASLYGYNFTTADFTNPLNVGPNASNIDFAASAPSNAPPAAAATIGQLVSSLNPSQPGQLVSVTFSLSAAPPANGTPSGTVRFIIDGTNAATAPLNGGSATFATAGLDHGVHTVAAEYGGDANFTGTTNMLSPAQVINTPPVASPYAIDAGPTNAVKVSIAALQQNDSDADGDLISFVGVSATSAHGGTVVSNNGSLFYTAGPNPSPSDTFTYTITDGLSEPVTGVVTVNIRVDNGPSPNLRIIAAAGGSHVIRGDGIPGRAYRIEFSDVPRGTNWQTLGPATTDASGMFQLTDFSAAPQRFYRSVYP